MATISERYEAIGVEDIDEQETLFRQTFGHSWRLLPGEDSASPTRS
jgi:hypothetical protein